MADVVRALLRPTCTDLARRIARRRDARTGAGGQPDDHVIEALATLLVGGIIEVIQLWVADLDGIPPRQARPRRAAGSTRRYACYAC